MWGIHGEPSGTVPVYADRRSAHHYGLGKGQKAGKGDLSYAGAAGGWQHTGALKKQGMRRAGIPKRKAGPLFYRQCMVLLRVAYHRAGGVIRTWRIGSNIPGRKRQKGFRFGLFCWR